MEVVVMMLNDDSNYYSEDSNSRTYPTTDSEDIHVKNVHESNETVVIEEESVPLDSLVKNQLNRHGLLVLDNDNLQYRGEGNSSLVLALKQVSHYFYQRKSSMKLLHDRQTCIRDLLLSCTRSFFFSMKTGGESHSDSQET